MQYSLLNESSLNGVLTLENGEHKRNYTGLFKLKRVKESKKEGGRMLLFNLEDKEGVKDFLQFNPIFAFCRVEIPFNLYKLKNLTLIDIITSLILVIVVNFISAFITSSGGDPEFYSPVVSCIMVSSILFFIHIFKKARLRKIYDYISVVRDNFNILIEYNDLIKVYLKVKEDILKMSGFIGGSIDSICLIDNIDRVTKSKTRYARELFNTVVKIGTREYYTEVISDDTVLYIAIKSKKEQDVTEGYVTYDTASSLVETVELNDLIKMRLTA